MKTRHAAALALVGWYLMLTPLKRDNGQVTADLNAPISQWSVIQAFDTAIACNEAQIKWEKWTKRKAQETPSDKVKQADASAPTQCISTDDPRLKEKLRHAMIDRFSKYYELSRKYLDERGNSGKALEGWELELTLWDADRPLETEPSPQAIARLVDWDRKQPKS